MKCPGQDSRFWEAGAIFDARCPQCGSEVEFFKDEASRKCRNCGAKVVNPKMDFGCASYCRFAAQCLGDLPPELLAQRENLLRDRLAIEVKRRFKQDFRRIGRVLKVVRYAERIVKEEGGDPAIVLAAAYLIDMGGGCPAEERDPMQPGPQRTENLAAAEEILRKVGASEGLIRAICSVIEPGGEPAGTRDLNSRCLRDAEVVACLEEKRQVQGMPEEELKRRIERECFTETGTKLAKEILLNPISLQA